MVLGFSIKNELETSVMDFLPIIIESGDNRLYSSQQTTKSIKYTQQNSGQHQDKKPFIKSHHDMMIRFSLVQF